MKNDTYTFSETDFNEDNECVCILNKDESFVHSHTKRITNVGEIKLQIGFSVENNDFYMFTGENQEVKAESAGSNWGMSIVGYIPTYNAQINLI